MLQLQFLQLLLMTKLSSHLAPNFPFQSQLFSSSASLLAKRAAGHSKKQVQAPKTKGQKEPRNLREEDETLLPRVVLVGRPNVGKSALYNRLVRRKEALVYDTPGGHVTRDYREGVAQLSDLRFKLFDTAGMETSVQSGSLLERARGLTAKLLSRSHLALFMVDARAGVQPMDIDLARWFRRSSSLPVVLAANKCEGGHRQADYVMAAMGEAYQVGFGEAVAISAESGEGLADLYEKLQPHIDRVMADILAEETKRRERVNALILSNSRRSQTASGLRSSVGNSKVSVTNPNMIDNQVKGAVESRESTGKLEDPVEGAVESRESAGGVLEKGDIGSRSVHPYGSEGSAVQSSIIGEALQLSESQGSGSATINGSSSLPEMDSISSSLAPENAAKEMLEAGIEGSSASSEAEPQAGSDSTDRALLSTHEALSATRLSASHRPASLAAQDTPPERDSAGVGYGAFSVEQASEMQKQAEELEEARAVPLQFAIAGRPNVGKSTLVNYLLGQDRVLTGPEPGLTRDSVRIPFEHAGRPIWLVDTAGWMHRTKLEEGGPQLSAADARKNIMRAHVVALMLDAEEIVASGALMKMNEITLASWVLEEGRALIVLVNKIDALSGPEQRKLTKKLEEELNALLPQARGSPILTISALRGFGANKLMPKVMSVYDSWKTRLPTSRLNRWLQKIEMQMPNKPGYGVRVRYITQIKARPPTFVVFVSGAGEFPASRLRFIASGLRKEFGLEGVPLRMLERRVLRKGSTRKAPPKKSRRKH